MAAKKVLIIEDRRENIVFLANNVLRPQGYEVVTAMDGEQGLKRALADQPDLIIMDLNMPKRDGLEVMAALRERQLNIPIILTTFYGSEQVAQQAFRLGASGYIVKPYTPSEMLSMVEKVFAERSRPPAKQVFAERSQPPAKQAEPAEVMPMARQVERWMRDMNILHSVGKALVAQLDLGSVLSRAVEAAAYVSRAEQGFLFLAPEGAADDLVLRATRGPADRQMRVLEQRLRSRLVAEAQRSDKAVLRHDARDETALAEVAGQALGPLIAAPIRWRRQVIGVLVAARHPGDATFRDTDAEWLVGLADYVAIAVSNAREFQHQVQARTTPPDASWQQEMEQLAAGLEAAARRIRHLMSA